MRISLAILLLAAAMPSAEAATKVGFRGDGALMVDGKAVFPIGVRSEKLDTIGPLAKAGFNLVLGSGEWGAPHYRRAHEAGLLILAGHHVWLSFRGTRPAIDLRAREEALRHSVAKHATDWSKRTIHQALESFDALPGVIGWCISDEPESKLSEVAEAGYEIFKSNTPAHVIAQISPDPHWFKNFRYSADVLIVDHYPFRGSGNKGHQTVLQTYERVRQAVSDMDGKPVWLMPQLYPPSYWSCKSEEELTLRHMRLACYAGLIAGAKGIIMYHWGVLPYVWTRDGKDDRVRAEAAPATVARRVADIKAMVAELKTLAPIMLEGCPVRDISVRWTAPGRNGPGPQMARVWDLCGTRYLMAINPLDEALEGQAFGILANVNYRAYDAEIFSGKDDLAVMPGKRPGELTFRIAPRGAGVLALKRRPIAPPTDE